MRKRVMYTVVGAVLWFILVTQGAFVSHLPIVGGGGDALVLVARVATLISAVVFVLYGLDKTFSSTSSHRVPERVLLLLGVAGFNAGAFLGQAVFNHKLSKGSYQMRFMALNGVLAIVVLVLWLTN